MLIHEMTYIQPKSISGLASDESESMTIREGKIRGTNKLSYRNYGERSRRTSAETYEEFAGSQGESTAGEARC